MTPEQQTQKLIELTQAQNAILMTISRQLERLAQASAPASPNYRRRLSEYPQFDWSEIGATVAASDNQGVSEVEWNLHRFTRRAGSGKFGKAIWFSRPTGKDGDETNYARLITFKDGDAEPVPGDVIQQQQQRPQLVKSQGQADVIHPLDLYAPTKPKAAAPQPPTPDPRPPIAAPIQGDPRQMFYQIGGQATGKNVISFEVFNSLVSRASKEGYEAALAGLREVLRQAEAVELLAA